MAGLLAAIALTDAIASPGHAHMPASSTKHAVHHILHVQQATLLPQLTPTGVVLSFFLFYMCLLVSLLLRCAHP